MGFLASAITIIVMNTIRHYHHNHQVRAQSRLQESTYDRLSHRSDSRNDLLDNDHSVYEHSLYYQPGQYTGFVRTCDGKFVRTNIPQHDFETLDTNFYRNSNQVKDSCIGGL